MAELAQKAVLPADQGGGSCEPHEPPTRPSTGPQAYKFDVFGDNPFKIPPYRGTNSTD